MIKHLHWFKQSGFRWDGSKTVYFDPWKIPGPIKPGDVILISHEHFDHFSLDDLDKISTAKTVIVSNKVVADKVKSSDILHGDLIIMVPGDEVDISGVKIRAIESYNIGKRFHQKKENKLGFLVSMDGLVVYHAGDSDFIPEMKDLRCDIALLPIGGTYTMDAGEAAKAALEIKPKVAVPMHFGDVVGSAKDCEKFKELLSGKVEVSVLTKES